MSARTRLQPGDSDGDQLGSAGDQLRQRQPRPASLHRSFGAGGDNAATIAGEALRDWPTWRQAIENWQAPIRARSDLPEPLRMALLNELYDLASGGSLWTAATDQDPVGRFGVLECFDYSWYESLDVRLYGSFALLQLWPELDKAVLRSFARAIPAGDPTPRPIGWYFTQGRGRVEAPRKVSGATPHDLGCPERAPLRRHELHRLSGLQSLEGSGQRFRAAGMAHLPPCPRTGRTCASWPTAGRRLPKRCAI